jgi:hypothetical protein
MNRKLVLALALTLLVGMLSVAFSVQRAKASGTIHIRADGSIDPPDAFISTADYVTYALTGNIYSDADGIVVQRDNIVVDGAGYTVTGSGSGNGITLTERSDVTVRNVTIKNFVYGLGSSAILITTLCLATTSQTTRMAFTSTILITMLTMFFTITIS